MKNKSKQKKRTIYVHTKNNTHEKTDNQKTQRSPIVSSFQKSYCKQLVEQTCTVKQWNEVHALPQDPQCTAPRMRKGNRELGRFDDLE